MESTLISLQCEAPHTTGEVGLAATLQGDEGAFDPGLHSPAEVVDNHETIGSVSPTGTARALHTTGEGGVTIPPREGAVPDLDHTIQGGGLCQT